MKKQTTNIKSLKPEIEALEDIQFLANPRIKNVFEIKNTTYVGGYRLGPDELNSVQFNFTKKPKWFHRQFMRILLGFHWIDNK